MVVHCYLDAILLIFTIAEAIGAGLVSILGMVLISTCVWYSFKKRTKQAVTSVAYRNTTHMGTESHLKFSETDNEYVNKEVILCENESYGRVFREEAKEK